MVKRTASFQSLGLRLPKGRAAMKSTLRAGWRYRRWKSCTGRQWPHGNFPQQKRQSNASMQVSLWRTSVLNGQKGAFVEELNFTRKERLTTETLSLTPQRRGRDAIADDLLHAQRHRSLSSLAVLRHRSPRSLLCERYKGWDAQFAGIGNRHLCRKSKLKSSGLNSQENVSFGSSTSAKSDHQ